MKFLIPCVIFVIGLTNMSAGQQKPGNTVLGASNNKLAFDLYQKLSNDSKSLFFSPYSIFTALNMAAEGARGGTEKEMRNVLYSTDATKLRSAIKLSQERFNRADGDDSIYVANSLWLQKNMKLHAQFEDIVKQNYMAGLNNVDFVKDPEKQRVTINDWVAAKTRNRIKDLLVKGMITPDTRAVLVNAIWFKAKWQIPFQPGNTRDDKFYSTDGPVMTPLMNQTDYFKYADNDLMQLVELPYKNNGMSMLVLLPVAGKEKAFEEKFTLANLDDWIKSMSSFKVILGLPKFKMETSFDLGDTLASLGMPTAFTDYADFSGMTSVPLKISKVIHKAFVEVKEDGTEAAAATAVIEVEITSVGRNVKPSKFFRADRPFVFLIRDNSSGAILFMGKMEKP